MCKSSVLLFVAHRQYTFSALSYQGQHQQERESQRGREHKVIFYNTMIKTLSTVNLFTTLSLMTNTATLNTSNRVEIIMAK